MNNDERGGKGWHQSTKERMGEDSALSEAFRRRLHLGKRETVSINITNATPSSNGLLIMANGFLMPHSFLLRELNESIQ